jgi:hypothetical protein
MLLWPIYKSKQAHYKSNAWLVCSEQRSELTEWVGGKLGES